MHLRDSRSLSLGARGMSMYALLAPAAAAGREVHLFSVESGRRIISLGVVHRVNESERWKDRLWNFEGLDYIRTTWGGGVY